MIGSPSTRLIKVGHKLATDKLAAEGTNGIFCSPKKSKHVKQDFKILYVVVLTNLISPLFPFVEEHSRTISITPFVG